MKLFRYRKPSWRTVLGLTSLKKKVLRASGLTALRQPLRWYPNRKRRVLRAFGYESWLCRLIRHGLRRPFG